MTRRNFTLGAFIGAALGLPWMALLYLANQLADAPFTPFALFEWLVRALPGNVITLGLEIMIGTLQRLQLGSTSAIGKRLEALSALVFMEVLLAGLGGLYAALARRRAGPPLATGILPGAALGALSLALGLWDGWGAPGPLASAAWLFALSLIWGLALGAAAGRWGERKGQPAPEGRRAFLIQLGIGAAVLSAVGLGLERLLRPGAEPPTGPVAGVTPFPSEPAPTAEAGFVPVPGTRDKITPIEDFYRVDINLQPPSPDDVASESESNLAQVLRAQGDTTLSIPEAGYVLVLDGLVESPLRLTLDDLRSMPSIDVYATLECISNRVGGDLISTTLFTGVPLKAVLERAGLRAEATGVRFTCADGYTESLPMDSAMNDHTLLCYAMGSRPLASEHGFPVRLYTPNRFGMKNPKWIIQIEAISENYQGYWEHRGWSQDAWVVTTSVIDSTASDGSGGIEAGGIAFAGGRGIEAVEVRLGEAGDWVAAELDQALSPFTWVLWRARVQASPGQRRLFVRAVDGEGAVQAEERSDTYPNGAAGYHGVPVNPSG